MGIRFKGYVEGYIYICIYVDEYVYVYVYLALLKLRDISVFESTCVYIYMLMDIERGPSRVVPKSHEPNP